MEYTTEEIKKLMKYLRRYAKHNEVWGIFHEDLLKTTTNEELIKYSKDVKWARNPFNNTTTLYILIYEIPYENLPMTQGSTEDEITNLIVHWRYEIRK